jgi:predicted RNA-binding Zn-ribbon protein involved in translation (DUF1610 family)
MTNLPDGMVPGDEDPERYCEACGRLIPALDDGLALGGCLYCTPCGRQEEQYRREEAEIDGTCVGCGKSVDAKSATWDEFAEGYVCDDCADDLGVGEEGPIDG